MTESRDLSAYLDAAAALVGLPVAGAHRPEVLANLERAAELAALLEDFPLSDADDAAPVFTP